MNNRNFFQRNKKLLIIVASMLFILYLGANFYVHQNLKTVVEKATEMDLDGLPKEKVTLEFIQSRPEANLIYPGSKVISPFYGSEESTGFPDYQISSAFTGAVLQSNDSEELIYKWYKNQLLESGWQETNYLLTTTQKSLQGYLRGGREKFYVAINDPGSLSRTLGGEIPANGTIFEYRYMIIPYEK